LLTGEARNGNRTRIHNFPDVEYWRWSVEEIATLQRLDILSGYEDGTFRPSNAITRAEFAAVMMQFFEVDLNARHNFTDVSGHWAEFYIAAAFSNGFITGYPDGTFRPNEPITRAEAAALINNALSRHVDDAGIMNELTTDWPDLPRTHWAYFVMQEATTSHTHERRADGLEQWTGAMRDMNFQVE